MLKLSNTRILLVTNDQSDRHHLIHHLTGWQARLNTCNNSVRAFTSLVSAADEGTPYHIALVDQLHLDMEPKQFAASTRSEASLHDLSLIHIGPESSHTSDQQLLNAGFSCTLNTPIDKTLLFNALHAAGNTTAERPPAIASFINHYARERSTLPPLDILVAATFPNSKQIYRILKQSGHLIFTVENGEQALNALDSHYFDLTIMELEMPVMSGAEAIKLYRFTRPHDTWMPFIILTPEASPENILKCSQADADACLTGPTAAQPLLATIKQVFSETGKQGKRTKTRSRTTINSGEPGPSAPVNSPVLGRSRLRDLEELGSGQEFVHNLIESFLQDSENLLKNMEDAYVKKDYQAYTDHAHAFKDSAGSLGALAMYKISVTASRLREDDFQENGGRLIYDIHIAVESTRKALMDYLSEQDSSVSRR